MSEDKPGMLTVSCGKMVGLLHLDKFMCPGIHQECIEVEDKIITPKAFSVMGDKEKLKNWKNAVRLNGVSVKKRMDAGDLDFYNHNELCTGRCMARNFGTSKYDLKIDSLKTEKSDEGNRSSYTNSGDMPTLVPSVTNRKKSSYSSSLHNSPEVSAKAMPLGCNNNNRQHENRLPAHQPAPSQAVFPMPIPILPNRLEHSPAYCDAPDSPENLSMKREPAMEPDFKHMQPSSHNVQCINKCDNDSVVKKFKEENHAYLPNRDSPSVDHHEMMDNNIIYDYSKEKCMNNNRKSKECGYAYSDSGSYNEISDSPTDLSTSGTSTPSPSHRSRKPPNSGKLLREKVAALRCAAESKVVKGGAEFPDADTLFEDSVVFWQGIKDLGLLDEFVRDIKHSVGNISTDMQRMGVTEDDAQKLSNVATELGLITKLKWRLAEHKTHMEVENEKLSNEIEGTHGSRALKQKVAVSEMKQRELKRKSDCFDSLIEIGRPKRTPNGTPSSFATSDSDE